jgi:cytochrome P450
MLRIIQWLTHRERLLRSLNPLFGRFNPFLPAHRNNPHATWRALRESEPVYWHPVFRMWMLTRYEDVLFVLRDKNFTTDRSQVPLMRWISRMSRGDAQFSAIIERNLLTMDGPDHTRLRGLVSKAFTPRRVESLRPRLEQVVDGLLDDCAERDEMELVRDFAHPLPVIAIAELLGVPAEIVMPADAPALKLANTRAHGAEVVLYDRAGGENREDIGGRIAAERGCPGPAL